MLTDQSMQSMPFPQCDRAIRRAELEDHLIYRVYEILVDHSASGRTGHASQGGLGAMLSRCCGHVFAACAF